MENSVLDWLLALKARKTEFKWRNPQYGRIIMENMALKNECSLNGTFTDKTKNPPRFQYPIRRAQNWATVNQDPPANREG
jgi:hypothetical protein